MTAPMTRTTCPYCGVGCGVSISHMTDGFKIAGDAQHPANSGRLCSKGAALGETLGMDGRLLHPQVRGRRTAWNEALTEVASTFSRLVNERGPDAVAFYVSGQLLTEDYYVANKLMKGFIGSANIDTNSRLCMASAVAGYKRAFGSDTVPNSYEDLEQADLIVLVGSNTAWCHPVIYQRIGDAKAANPALEVVVIDPRRTATCDMADQFLPLSPGTDVLLFNGLLNYLRREDTLDWEFLDLHTEGIGPAMRVARETAPSIPSVATGCGLPERAVAEFYRTFARCRRTVTLFSQGVNQSSSGTDKVNSIINVHLATGRIGKPGAGPFSITGQPNAMGGREVGGLANQLAAHMDFEPEQVNRVQRFWGSPSIASQPGLKAVDLFDAIEQGKVRAVWIMATNPVASMPDADRVRAALRRADLVVVSDCVRETDTTACADILLPAATWGEKSGTVTNSERCISRQRAFLQAPGDSAPDWWIITQVARRMGFADAFAYQSPVEIFREHARLSGFENDGSRDFDIGALAEISDDGYETFQPVRWPLPAGPGNKRMFADGRFYTPTGRARFVATQPRSPDELPTRRYPLVLNTGRVRDQWHTMTRTGKSARLSRHRVEPFVQVHPADASALGLTHGALAKLESPRAHMLARVQQTEDVQPGQLFAPMHWTDQVAVHGRVGALIKSATDPHSGQPELKHTPVAARPCQISWYAFAIARNSLEIRDCSYRVRARGDGYWRYELAGETHPESWEGWARATLGEGGEWIAFSDAGAGRHRFARLTDRRLQACLFVASDPNLPDREWLGSLFGDETLGSTDRNNILVGRPVDAAPNGGPVVCACFSVGRDTLIQAIRTRQLTSVEEVGRQLNAGSNCGSCIPELNALISGAHASQRPEIPS